MDAQVEVHELADVVDHLPGVFEGFEAFPHHPGTHDFMLVEGDAPAGFRGTGGHFADVVEEGRPAQH